MSPKLQSVFVSLRMARRQQWEEREETSLLASSDLLITARRLFLHSNVDVQISQSASRELARPPATQDNPTMTCNYDGQRVEAIGKALECGPRVGEGRMRSGIAFRGKRTGRQTLTRRTEKYAEERLSHVVSHICRRPH